MARERATMAPAIADDGLRANPASDGVPADPVQMKDTT